MHKYIIADTDLCSGWGHIFAEPDFDSDDPSASKNVERICRFVYDTESESIIHMQILYPNRGWMDASRDEIADIEDSLRNANPEAIENPEDYGLVASDDLPDWCKQAPRISM